MDIVRDLIACIDGRRYHAAAAVLHPAAPSFISESQIKESKIEQSSLELITPLPVSRDYRHDSKQCSMPRIPLALPVDASATFWRKYVYPQRKQLFLTYKPDGERAFFVKRRDSMFLVYRSGKVQKINCKDIVYNCPDCVLDGELVQYRQQGICILLLFDFLQWDRLYYSRCRFSDRFYALEKQMNVLKQLSTGLFVEGEEDVTFLLRLKPIFPCHEFPPFSKFLTNNNNNIQNQGRSSAEDLTSWLKATESMEVDGYITPCDGLIGLNGMASYQAKQRGDLVKLKRFPTADFACFPFKEMMTNRLSKKGDLLITCHVRTSSYKFQPYSFVEWPDYIHKLLTGRITQGQVIVECKGERIEVITDQGSKIKVKWIPQKIRWDKEYPNYLSVVQDIEECIVCPVLESDICALFDSEDQLITRTGEQQQQQPQQIQQVKVADHSPIIVSKRQKTG